MGWSCSSARRAVGVCAPQTCRSRRVIYGGSSTAGHLRRVIYGGSSTAGLQGSACVTSGAKSISDASWSMFRFVLTSKAESADREVIAANPAYTSQDCSVCGYRPNGLEGRAKKKLSDR